MRNITPDKRKAESVVESAERDMKFTLSLQVSDASGATIIRNIYESFRMLGDALLVMKGIKPHDHASQIKELVQLHVATERPIRVLENLKDLRHNINYHGYSPNESEVKDAIDIAKKLFKPLAAEVKNRVTRM